MGAWKKQNLGLSRVNTEIKKETKFENGGESGVIQLGRHQNERKIKAKRKRGVENKRETQTMG